MRQNQPMPTHRNGMKHPDCPFYGECLSLAVRRKWNTWSCGNCSNHLLKAVNDRLQFIIQYCRVLFDIYPEFKRKYEPGIRKFGQP